jgi:hypothetical protein
MAVEITRLTGADSPQFVPLSLQMQQNGFEIKEMT